MKRSRRLSLIPNSFDCIYIPPLLVPHGCEEGSSFSMLQGHSIQEAADNLGLRNSWPRYSEHKESCS